MAEPGEHTPYQGPFGPLRRIDDWIFAIEMAVLWTFLGVSCAMVFLDVMYRRLAAPDSKIGELLARIFGVEDPDAVERLNTLGPILSAVVGVAPPSPAGGVTQAAAQATNAKRERGESEWIMRLLAGGIVRRVATARAVVLAVAGETREGPCRSQRHAR